jgi:hypothetical protein
MWENRNKFLHNNGTTIHLIEMAALDEEIRIEWDIGLDQLNEQYRHFFQGQLQHRLDDTVHHKLMWKSSVWSARDNDLHIGPLRTRNEVIVNIYNRWRSKKSLDV